MASTLYPLFLQALLSGDVDLTTDTVKAVLIDSADETYSASDEFLDDITADAIVGTAAALASKTVALGVFDAADTTLSDVSGDPTESVLLYIDTGTDSTSRLIGLFDASFTPNGSDALITWPAGGIFAL